MLALKAQLFILLAKLLLESVAFLAELLNGAAHVRISVRVSPAHQPENSSYQGNESEHKPGVEGVSCGRVPQPEKVGSKKTEPPPCKCGARDEPTQQGKTTPGFARGG